MGAPPPEAEKVASGPGPAREAPKITTVPEGIAALDTTSTLSLVYAYTNVVKDK